jgi:hypothetical protein
MMAGRTCRKVNRHETAMDWSKAVVQKARMLLEPFIARFAIGRDGR